MLGDEKISLGANGFFFFNFYDLAHWSEIRQVAAHGQPLFACLGLIL